MDKIEAHDCTLYYLLFNKKYVIHYYQREYRWGTKQVKELLEDITEEFLPNYSPGDSRKQVKDYSNYYMGSVITTQESDRAIIDGQQRLTTLTLLLIHLNRLRKKICPEYEDFSQMIYSTQYGERTFNINDEGRKECMEALFKGTEYKGPTDGTTVSNLLGRFEDIESLLDPALQTEEVLPFFLDWIMYHLVFIEISVSSEQDAHKVFVTMNDRGLSLSPTEMLKGYILSEIKDDGDRARADDVWKSVFDGLLARNREEGDADDDFMKTWLRSRYAETIRENKKGAEPRDFDLIGSEFHKWVRSNADSMGLDCPKSFSDLVGIDLKFYSELYMRIKDLSERFDKGFEDLYYNARLKFTFQFQLILSAVSPSDGREAVDRKIRMVSRFANQYVMLFGVNYRDFSYSNVKRSMFMLTKDIRGMDAHRLGCYLADYLDGLGLSMDGIDSLRLSTFTKRFIPFMLARIAFYLEEGCMDPSRGIAKYMARGRGNNYDVEHIIADSYESYRDAFDDEEEFKDYRSRLGNLILLPADKNRSIQDQTYEEKLDTYAGENILAKTLCSGFYKNNPRLRAFVEESGLDWHPLDSFGKEEIQYRQGLYKETAKAIWDVSSLRTM